jgi:hypothetical protein
MGKAKKTTKSTLINMRKAIEKARNECNKLPCECDSYNGFSCPIHDWERTLEYLGNQVNDAIKTYE